MRIIKISLLVIPVGLLTGCGSTKDKTTEVQEQPEKNYTIETAYMDKSVRPQDDFFQYANGTWIKNNPIPASESRWSSFNELDQANKVKLTTILEDAIAANAEKGTDQQLIGDYYKSMKDMDQRNTVGIKAIESYIQMINEINSKKQLGKVTSALHSTGIGAFFNLYVGQDLKNVDQNVVYFSQGGIGLPNRDY